MASSKPKVFFSFHFAEDAWRAGTVRQIGAVEGNEPVKDNDWEAVKRGGDAAIKRWIDEQLKGRTCTVVLVGHYTAQRPWIIHEIVESWNRGIGVVGVRIDKLLNQKQAPGVAGSNPFAQISLNSGPLLSTRVSLHDPVGFDSKTAYASIANNLATWIASAAHK